MKKLLLILCLICGLPTWVMAQDDLYFVPKKKVDVKVEGTSAKVVLEKDRTPVDVYSAPKTTIIMKDVQGNERDLDEYNRRYTSRDNTFEIENDTLYIEEKPYNERGEWVHGFEGTQDDYEYAMRIIRFRNPRYAIPVSSPLYWDVVYGLPSWEWNVFDDGMYAYVFPTYTNRLWWDWRWNYTLGSSWSISWGWHSPWWNNWYGPGYWGSYWGYHYHHHWHPSWHHHHYRPWYAGVGGYWGGHGQYGSTARKPGIHAGRYKSSLSRSNLASTGSQHRVTSTSRTGRTSNDAVRQSRRTGSSDSRNNATQQSVRRTTTGRVVRSTNNDNSVRPRTTTVRSRNQESVGTRSGADVRSRNNMYVRSTESKGSTYNRPSSTRSSVTNRSSSYQRRNASEGTYRSNSSTSTRNNSTYRNSSSSGSRSSSVNSYSGGNSRSSVGGGSSRSSGGGSSRGGRR